MTTDTDPEEEESEDWPSDIPHFPTMSGVKLYKSAEDILNLDWGDEVIVRVMAEIEKRLKGL